MRPLTDIKNRGTAINTMPLRFYLDFKQFLNYLPACISATDSRIASAM